jgi:hypothetical protein
VGVWPPSRALYAKAYFKGNGESYMKPLDELEELLQIHTAYESLCLLAGISEAESERIADLLQIINIQFQQYISNFEIRHVKAPRGRSPNFTLIED